MREDATANAPDAGVADLLRLQRTAGNHAVAQLLARNQAGAPPVKDRKPIDDLAGKQNVKPVDRVKEYAKIAGTGAVNMDPGVVTESGPVKDGLNMVQLKQASGVPAKTDFVEQSQINPKFFYKPYFLEPQKGGEKAYALLHKALTASGRLGGCRRRGAGERILPAQQCRPGDCRAHQRRHHPVHPGRQQISRDCREMTLDSRSRRMRIDR